MSGYSNTRFFGLLANFNIINHTLVSFAESLCKLIVIMPTSLLSLPIDVISYMFKFIHIINLYQLYKQKVNQLFCVLCIRAISSIKDVMLIIQTSCVQNDVILIEETYKGLRTITTNVLGIDYSMQTRNFINWISSKVKIMCILDVIYSIHLDLSNVHFLHWCYPRSNLPMIKNLRALKWCHVCSIDESIWNLLAEHCPTLEMLNTTPSRHISDNNLWECISSRNLPSKTMSNLIILIVSRSVSIKLVSHLIVACPDLLHLMIDGMGTFDMDTSVNPPRRMKYKLLLPANLVSFSMSGNSSEETFVDFRQCCNLRLLNLPMLQFGVETALSQSFQNFLQFNDNNQVLIVFKHYQLLLPRCESNENSIIVQIKKSLASTLKIIKLLHIVIVNEKRFDTYIQFISNILNNVFSNNNVDFIKTKNIKTMFINHLIKTNAPDYYIQLITQASKSGFITDEFAPLIDTY